MTRAYKRKRWGSKERRIEGAVRLRAEGLSLREIAKRLKVSKDTVMRDLAQAAVSHLPVSPGPFSGRLETVDETASETPLPLSQVIQLAERRRA